MSSDSQNLNEVLDLKVNFPLIHALYRPRISTATCFMQDENKKLLVFIYVSISYIYGSVFVLNIFVYSENFSG